MTTEENSFKEKLEDTHQFPCLYTFKFIVRWELKKGTKQLLKGLLKGEVEIKEKSSSNGKYTGITLTSFMTSGSEVVHVYKKAKEVDGVISL